MVVQSPTAEHAEQCDPSRGATGLHFKYLDGLIEAGVCPDRSGLRRSSVVLVNQATQEVTTSDRVIDA
jgi:hypothetical protein